MSNLESVLATEIRVLHIRRAPEKLADALDFAFVRYCQYQRDLEDKKETGNGLAFISGVQSV